MIASSVYIHVPFCRSRCLYCDFVVVLDKYGGHEAYVEALCQEIRLKTASQAFASKEPLKTLYVGGGTPTLLSAQAYQRLFEALAKVGLLVDDHTEVTLEANPDDWRDAPELYLDAGFNRVSLGAQSLEEPLLKKLSRRHSPETVFEKIDQLRHAGFNNISVDLMYGLPFQGLDDWKSTLEKLIYLDIPHVSAYGLSLHQSTPLNTLVQKGAYPLPDDEATVQMYDLARLRLEEAGYVAYEFSNFAKPGFESRHNLAYWENKNWWAFGVGAHGKIDGIRAENTPDFKTYLENPLTTEHIVDSEAEQLENSIIFGLRLAKGLDWEALQEQFSQKLLDNAFKIIQKWQTRGVLSCHTGRVRLLPAYIANSNTVLSDFMGLKDNH